MDHYVVVIRTQDAFTINAEKMIFIRLFMVSCHVKKLKNGKFD